MLKFPKKPGRPEGAEPIPFPSSEQGDKVQRDFHPDFEKERLADQTAEIIQFPVADREVGEHIHKEAGVPLKIEYKTDKERAEAVNRLMSDKATPFEKQERLSQLSDDHEQQEAA